MTLGMSIINRFMFLLKPIVHCVFETIALELHVGCYTNCFQMYSTMQFYRNM